MRIFVYGTLKRGHFLHEYLADSVFLGEYATPPKYSFYDLTHYPAMSLHNEGVSVKGEVFQIDVDKLAILDMVEGVPDLYNRVQIQCGKYGRCFTYVMRNPPKNAPLIKTGEWV